MPEAVLDILKYFFLFLIFLFLARAVKAMILEISPPKNPRPVARGASPAPAAALVKPMGRPPEKMAVTAPDAKSRTFDLVDELIIGRADKCHVVIGDSYASQVHARVFRKQDNVYIEDMGSTNGTYLNRKKITSPAMVSRGDVARIGKTQMEFKK
jgi:pSer/pThr/pTyr-binding forkhead associated (FHA) protein